MNFILTLNNFYVKNEFIDVLNNHLFFIIFIFNLVFNKLTSWYFQTCSLKQYQTVKRLNKSLLDEGHLQTCSAIMGSEHYSNDVEVASCFSLKF